MVQILAYVYEDSYMFCCITSVVLHLEFGWGHTVIVIFLYFFMYFSISTLCMYFIGMFFQCFFIPQKHDPIKLNLV